VKLTFDEFRRLLLLGDPLCRALCDPTRVRFDSRNWYYPGYSRITWLGRGPEPPYTQVDTRIADICSTGVDLSVDQWLLTLHQLEHPSGRSDA
jgi:hypothetical protein